MKTLKFKPLNLLYLLLVLIFSVGCNNKQEPAFKTKKCIVIGINTSGFKAGDVLAVGDSGQLIKAEAKDIDNVVGIVVCKDSVNVFNFKTN